MFSGFLEKHHVIFSVLLHMVDSSIMNPIGFKWSNAQKVKRSRLLIKATFIILTKELHGFSKQSISGVNV